VTLFHVITPLNCYYGNNFSSIGRVLLVMWHTAVQYRLVHTQNVSDTISLPLCCRVLLGTPTVGKRVKRGPPSYGTRRVMTLSSRLHQDGSNCFPSSYMFFDYNLKVYLPVQCVLHALPFRPILTLTISGKQHTL
jgi:hypothetical protein